MQTIEGGELNDTPLPGMAGSARQLGGFCLSLTWKTCEKLVSNPLAAVASIFGPFGLHHSIQTLSTSPFNPGQF